jgi:ubiquinone/menaquinone biosynthesis C-methylase UbiE
LIPTSLSILACRVQENLALRQPSFPLRVETGNQVAMILRKHSYCFATRPFAPIAGILILLPLLNGQSVHPVTGRRIASVMGARGADWLDRAERQSEENPEFAIDQLHLKPGMVIADIGAGTGYYSLRMAKRVSPTGKVFAVDIQPEMLDRLRVNAKAAAIVNIEPVLGTESDPKLPASTVDLAIMVDVYHELSRPQRILEHLHDALKPDGQLVLLEYRKEDPSVPIRSEHKMSLAEVKAEIEPEHYRFVRSIESLPWQHMIFFTPSGATVN